MQSATPALSPSPCSRRLLLTIDIYSSMGGAEKDCHLRVTAWIMDGGALPGTCGALLIATRRRLRGLRSVWHRWCIIRIVILFVVVAFRHAPSRPARPFIFRRGRLANGDDSVVPDSAPVLAAGGALSAGPAVPLVACVVHTHFTVRSGARVAAREDLFCLVVRRPAQMTGVCKSGRTSKQMVQSITSSG